MVNDNIDPMVPNRSKVVIEPKLAPAERNSSERRSIDGRSTQARSTLCSNIKEEIVVFI